MGNGDTFPELSEQDCKIHNVLAKGTNARLKAMEKTLYDDKAGLTRVVPVILSQNRTILVLLVGELVAIVGGIITILAKGGT
jgi:hypothetical protein